MVYGYARVSTLEQNVARQKSAIESYKTPDRIFLDKVSGKDFERPEYQKMKYLVNTGDEVIIKDLDRLGRNKEGIKSEIAWFKNRGVTLRVLNVPTTLMDFSCQTWIGDMLNNILIEVLGAFAQNEREEIKRRQREGIDAMKEVNGKKISAKTGRYMGRPTKDVPEEVLRAEFANIINGEKTVSQVIKELGISRPTWLTRIRKLNLI